MRAGVPKAVLWGRGAQLVAAFRGTVIGDDDDFFDDAALALGEEEARPRFQDSRRWVLSLRRRFPHSRLTLAAHSLGGSIALFCAYNVPGVAVHAYEAFGSTTMEARGATATAIANYTHVVLHVVLEDVLALGALLIAGPTHDTKNVLDGFEAHALANWL
ncbi:MAG: hypothetical protein ACRECQ_09740 [Burkholderiaceae bacterium]